MEIKTQIVNSEGKKFDVIYEDDITKLDKSLFSGVSGHCFFGDKLVIVRDNKMKWNFTGGGIEKGETFEEATVREVKEEANMRVLHQEFICCQTLSSDDGRVMRHVSSFCIVEPYGDFVSDPDEDIIEIKLIDPENYKQYFDWGKTGDLIMAKAMDMKSKYK